MRRRLWGLSRCFEKISRTDYSQFSKRIKIQQVIVSGDDKIGFAANSEFKELVIFGIATNINLFCDLDQFGFFEQSHKKPQALRLSQIPIKFFASEDFGNFKQNWD